MRVLRALCVPPWLGQSGVVDSADIPLNISRESMQDTALMRRIRSVLTRKVLKYVKLRVFVVTEGGGV